MGLIFECDARKAASNRKKHGVSFDDASTVFADNLSLTAADPLHSEDEARFVTLGRARSGRLLVVVHAQPRTDGVAGVNRNDGSASIVVA